MTQIETVSFTCQCGKRLMARADQAGRSYACPGCGSPVTVPSFGATPSAVAPAESAASAAASSESGGFLSGAPTSVPELLLILFIGWSVASFVCLLLSFFGTTIAYVALAVFVLLTLVALYQAWSALIARQLVLSRKDVPLLFNTVRLIAWDPTEGVLILRNKAVSFTDDDLHDGKGGVKMIHPMLGDELALRVPLEVQTLQFSDANVLTREYLNLSIRGTMKWRIVDIKQFYLLVSRELRSTGDGAASGDRNSASGTTGRLVNAAIEWLRGLASEQTRTVVSRVRSGLLIADRLMADVPEVRSSAGVDTLAAPAEFGGATEGLASAIHQTLAERLKDYGIAVIEVSLQEIKLPEEIVQQCVTACKTAYLPTMAHRQAAHRRAELKAEVDLLGKEAVGLREVVRHAPAYALGEFLSEFVAQRTQPTVNAGSPSAAKTIDVGTLDEIDGGESSRESLPAPQQGDAEEREDRRD